MKKAEVTVELDPVSLERIQTLAKEKGILIAEETEYLLKNGIAIVDRHLTKEDLAKPGEEGEIYDEPR